MTDGLPTMGEQAEAELNAMVCTCGKPDTPGVMHRQDAPCYVVATLPPGHEPMYEEEWERNKLCETAKRDHKWRWKVDITTGLPSLTQAICVHCGIETRLAR